MSSSPASHAKNLEAADKKKARQEKVFSKINAASGWLDALGFSWVTPLLKITAGDNFKEQLGELRRVLIIPMAGIMLFLVAWSVLAPKVTTSLGTIPGPLAVWEQTINLWDDHVRERKKADAFFERQEKRNEKLIAEGKAHKVKQRRYTGKPTYIDQIFTSLITVGLGFIIASAIAIPLGIASGLSKAVNGAINPLIQIFKPVSPLAWLPIVTMIVSAAYANPTVFLPKSLVVSAV
ncbi:MAG: hypothetical protein JKY04_02050, partial [Sneathiella sp.]|nr:hypothetical protein [Sneathiella sp.]